MVAAMRLCNSCSLVMDLAASSRASVAFISAVSSSA
jgi:hypothetical protein